MDYYRVNEKETDVGKAILHLYENNLFSDATVMYIPGNINFNVHKLVLAMHSPVLSDRFYPKDNTECNVLHVENFPLAAVKNMINYFYDKPPEFENISHIKETKRIAAKYKIRELEKICMNQINGVTVDVSNVLMALDVSREYGYKEKEMQCFDIISCNKETVFASEAFMKLEFDIISYIFEKLREMGSLTEVQYLRSALSWMARNGHANKKKLMDSIQVSQLSMVEFRDVIISYPRFLTNVEISEAFEKIKSSHSTQEESTQTPEVGEISSESDSGIEDISINGPSNEQAAAIPKQKRKLTISILDGAEDTKEAIVAIEDEIAVRSLRFRIVDDMKEGILASLSQENGDHTFEDVDVTYNGLYFMMAFLRDEGIEMSPVNFIEVLKAAVFFQLQNLQDACLVKVGNIVDYDPVFLNALGQFPFFDDRFLQLLKLYTKNIIVHPNFIDCSVEFIGKLLTQPVLCLPSELQLLLVTICWLEARNRLRWEYRFSLLNEIAFENISHSDLEYVLRSYPNFFTKDEMSSLTLYKTDNNNTAENKALLPQWYNFKVRMFQKGNESDP